MPKNEGKEVPGYCINPVEGKKDGTNGNGRGRAGEAPPPAVGDYR